MPVYLNSNRVKVLLILFKTSFVNNNYNTNKLSHTYCFISIGHGGFRAAQYCKDNLLNYAVKDPEYLSNPGVALRNAFFRLYYCYYC